MKTPLIKLIEKFKDDKRYYQSVLNNDYDYTRHDHDLAKESIARIGEAIKYAEGLLEEEQELIKNVGVNLNKEDFQV